MARRQVPGCGATTRANLRFAGWAHWRSIAGPMPAPRTKLVERPPDELVALIGGLSSVRMDEYAVVGSYSVLQLLAQVLPEARSRRGRVAWSSLSSQWTGRECTGVAGRTSGFWTEEPTR